MSWNTLKIPLLFFALGLLVLIAGGISVRATAAELTGDAVDLHQIPYTTSATCQSCHPGHFETWHQTFHRTMTQQATDQAVVADFDDATLVYQGIESSFKTINGQYVIDTIGRDGQPTRYPIVMTVGSRRIQQYVTQAPDGSHWRVPLAWNIEEGRWFNLNGGFLHPDAADFNAHLSIWDANCIFCHNTQANPGYDWDAQTFSASVSELGIACESCHGPAAEHARRNSNPVRRYWLHLTDPEQLRDPTLISPNELSDEQSVQVCGHCHGQRIPDPPESVQSLMSFGDPYRAGDDLSNHYTPIFRDSEIQGVDLSKRFWNDGTPRLTAYEYQGWIMSDHQDTGLTCISCHNMHGGDPEGMIDPVMRGNEGCLQCHSEIEEAISAHTKHEVESAGSSCYSCHMPKTTYGVLEIHPSHRIMNPEPARAWEYEMPEACTVCHTNETAAWAAEHTAELWEHPVPTLPTEPQFAVAENVRALLMGDVIQRSVAAMAFSEVGDYSAEPNARLWAAPFLILEMERDDYPAIRHFAYRSLKTLAEEAEHDISTLPFFDHMADPATRQSAVDAWWMWWDTLDKSDLHHPGEAVPLSADFALDWETVDALWALRNNELITIGE